MSKSFSNSYKEAGVDITAGYRSVEMMKQHIAKTMVFGNTSDVWWIWRTYGARYRRNGKACFG